MLQFSLDGLTLFLRQNEVKHLCTAPYYLPSNGAAQQLVQTFFKQAMRAAAGNRVMLQVSGIRYQVILFHLGNC